MTGRRSQLVPRQLAPRPCRLIRIVALTLTACSGRVIGTDDTTPAPAALCQGHSPDPGPAVVRRLTRLEYGNTVRDLLGTTNAVWEGFPTEERRLGFDNNAAALGTSPALVEQYLHAAETLAAEAVSTHYAALVPCDPVAAGVDACGRQFIDAFAAKAYRAPLTSDDRAVLGAVFDAGKVTDFKTGVRLVIEAVLQSPRFLYRVELGVAPTTGAETVVALSDWEMASRLSYLLWHTMPDEALRTAAAAGQLTSPADIDLAVERMLDDGRARAMVTDFYDQWLRVREIATVEKDPAVFPLFSGAIATLMHEETERYLDAVTWDEGGDLATLFTGAFTFVNGPLASHYGLGGVGSGSPFVKISLAGSPRAGLLTQGGLLSLLAKANQTSPVHRGKFVREQLLCTDLPPPPADLVIKPPELSTTLTTRERFSQHASDVACASCHRLMDPIGLGFERFDGAGQLRLRENGKDVDAHGEVVSSDVAGPFDGPIALEQALARSDQVRACVATKWFRYAYGRGETPADACTLAELRRRFAAHGFKFRDLLSALARVDAFRYRRLTPAAGGS